RFLRRIDDDAPARKPLADVIVGIALELESHAVREPRAEAAPGAALELRVDRVRRKAGMAVAPRHLAREHRADGAVAVVDRALDEHGAPGLERARRLRDEFVVERFREAVVLRFALVDRHAVADRRAVEEAREVQAL